MSRPVIFTIGHSTRTTAQFVGLLASHGVQEIVDVRTIPKSRHNPQFNEGALRASLVKAGVRYLHLAKLGGLRHARKDSTNLGWRNASFRGYADYMQTADFEKGLRRLMSVARARPVAVMCAEAVPWRCHRSLIADALVKQGWTVRHIQSGRTANRHTLTPFLRMRRGMIAYPAPSRI